MEDPEANDIKKEQENGIINFASETTLSKDFLANGLETTLSCTFYLKTSFCVGQRFVIIDDEMIPT